MPLVATGRRQQRYSRERRRLLRDLPAARSRTPRTRRPAKIVLKEINYGKKPAADERFWNPFC